MEASQIHPANKRAADNVTSPVVVIQPEGPVAASDETEPSGFENIAQPNTNDGNNETASKKPQLSFRENDFLFTAMARIYIKRELFKYGPRSRWADAMAEFYQDCGMGDSVERKTLQQFRDLFDSALKYRIKKLPPRNDTEPEEVSLCRQIMKTKRKLIVIAEEAAATKRAEQANEKTKDNNNNSNRTKDTSSSNNGSRKRKRPSSDNSSEPPPDIDMTEELRERLEDIGKHVKAEEDAKKTLQEAERAFEEAKKRLQEAQEHKDKVSQVTRESTKGFRDELANQTGPWMEKYKQLKAYYEEKNHCLVRDTKGDPQLNALRLWTKRQRERYHLKKDHPNKLPWYLVQMLEELQFPWKYVEDTWMKHLNELKQFKEEHGHAAVPRGYKKNPTLAHWLKRMRHEGVRFRQDPQSASITAEQYKLLEDAGMVWFNLSRTWNERFNDLLEFKEKHGHCNVPRDHENKKLVAWCQNQRAFHRAYLLGKKTHMDAARKKQLEDVGFQWNVTTSVSDSRRRHQNKKEDSADDASDDEEETSEEEEEGAPEPSPAMVPAHHPVDMNRQTPPAFSLRDNNYHGYHPQYY